MNEHIRKGNEALAKRDFEAARAEFSLALSASDSLTRRIATNRLRDLQNEPVPLQVAGWEEQIMPATRSRCCGARAIFVRSREGGFVAKNCTGCKKSAYARASDFPLAECCSNQWPVIIIDKNYHYRCGVCGATILIANHVPVWSDLFPYDPLPEPGDPGWDAV